MTMVYCRGCGQEIHESAEACPGCGAAQRDSQSVIEDYETFKDVPWYRRTLAIVAFLVLLPPALWLVCLTGDVYYKGRDGKPKANGVGPRIALVLMSLIWMYSLGKNQ